MSEPVFSGHIGAQEHDIKMLSGHVNIGATGAPTLKGYHVTFTRTGVGAYTVTLPRVYRKLILPAFEIRQASTSLRIYVTGDSVSSAGTFTIVARNTSGTATEISSGDNIHYALLVSASPVNRV